MVFLFIYLKTLITKYAATLFACIIMTLIIKLSYAIDSGIKNVTVSKSIISNEYVWIIMNII